MSARYETVIGLEVHCQLKTKSKIFSACPVGVGAEPNVFTEPVTLGLPGVLPVLNREVVRMAIMLGLATDCTIRLNNRFARKHYFYPDLPKGYQISQYDEPICEGGHLTIEKEGGNEQRVRLNRIHLEEDAGKIVHDPERNESRVDYNRAGVALVEVVSEPDLGSPDEVVCYMKALHNIVRYLDVCDGNMENGNFRCDANISLRPVGQTELGTKAELKNMNSFRNVHRALVYEQERQARILNEGGKIVQETRLWNDDRGVTESMRSKEEAHDYRYFPDPDLLPLVLEQSWVDEIRLSLPELPRAKKHRYVEELSLGDYDAGVLTATPELADFYEGVLKHHSDDPKKAANWVTTELLGALSADGRSITESPVGPEAIALIVTKINDGTISGKMAKSVFDKVYKTKADVDSVISDMGSQITDTAQIDAIIDDVLANNTSQVEQYRAGKGKVLGYFVGQVMKATRGRANPAVVNQILLEKLDP